jgi:hypothetical protein
MTLQRNVNMLAVKVQEFWTQDVPLWHFYPLIVSKSRIGESSGTMNSLAVDPNYEMFENLTTSSKAFLSLTTAVAVPNPKLSRALILKSSSLHNLWMTSPPEKERVDTGRLSYQWVSFRILNYYVSTDGKQTCGEATADDYTELYTGGLTMKARQLRQLAVQQNYQHTASQQSAKQNKAGLCARGAYSDFTCEADMLTP